MLTLRQRELLDFIQEFTAIYGYSPSFAEMQEGIFLKSKSGVHRLLSQLEERGFIKRIQGRWRAIEIIDMLEDRLLHRATDEQIMAEAMRRKLILFSRT